MSAISMGVPNTDYDAAQALLDLRSNLKPENPYVWQSNDRREDMEKEATLFWNCFISSNIPASSNINLDSNAKVITVTEYPKPDTHFETYSNKITNERVFKENVSGYFNNPKNRKFKFVNDPTIPVTSPSASRFEIDATGQESNEEDVQTSFDTEYNGDCTRDVGTQTEEGYFNPNIELMETTIRNLCERIQSLEAQLKEHNPAAEHSVDSTEQENNIDDTSYESQNNDYGMNLNENNTSEPNISQFSEYSSKSQYENPDNRKRSIQNKDNNALHNRVLTRYNINNSYDLVPIGDGHATVPSKLLRHINWNSYTSATRKLLTAVFSRRILATHSLTGKRSPAFPNKPAKKRLNPALVSDIVQTVVERCSVPENVVRTSITTKCADESKMFRTRQKNKTRRISKKNVENVPPTTSESESDHY